MNETDREAGLNLHAPEGDVTVAERRADDPDPDLERLGRVDGDLLEDQRLPGGPAHGGCSPPGRKAVRRLAVGWKKKEEGTARGDGCSFLQRPRGIEIVAAAAELEDSLTRLRTFASDRLGPLALHGRRLAGVVSG